MTITDTSARGRDHRSRVQSAASKRSARSLRRPLPERAVLLVDSIGVVSASVLDGDVTVAWIRTLGYDAERIDARCVGARTVLPRVLLVRGTEALSGLAPTALKRMRVVVLVDGAESVTVPRTVRVIRNDHRAGEEIRTAIAELLGVPPAPQPVPLSPREQEVLATYVLGATVAETAEIHFIAECTVRTHYRRVTRRYDDAGRPVTNKAQLLLAMVSDGWLRLDGSLGRVDGLE
ncbi:helix-turn-helix transcriptional regulator [Gordonia hydrophobica]|uniref:LuxR C-terminal-related transcriptional regulator n=1 Tax=Gordonia hydrophobica TaxID=40516 RepID=A0ABZ2U5F7_9ACTN|nr:LuxR C-terminal-related transcriptional regulator [Gordonia hydrophobica]MBM7368797.1 DNA-binding CsgD family transcriptional regulator [Gordonia hydrophobica]